jgi:hypothetical protein
MSDLVLVIHSPQSVIPDNRRYIRKYVEVFQFPDGRIEIRAAGTSLPYRTYNKLGTVDHGEIVNNKRLSSILEAARTIQSRRDHRVVRRSSTAHRVDGSPIPKNKIAGSKRQRDLSEMDLHDAINLPEALVRTAAKAQRTATIIMVI